MILPLKQKITPAAVTKLIFQAKGHAQQKCGCVAGQMLCSYFCHCRRERSTCQNCWTLLKQRIEDANDLDAYESNDDDK